MSTKSFKIGHKEIGHNAPCFFIAEIGSNHNGDYDTAKKLIDLAAEAQVDAVKFQTFRAKTHYSKYTPRFDYSEEIAAKAVHEMIESLEIDWTWHQPLKEYAEKAGLIFLTSPCDYESIDLMKQINLDAYKIASFDITDIELIEYMAQTNKPVLISTGMADMNDIERAISACHKHDNHNIVVFQCTSMYPAPPHLADLNVIPKLSEDFNIVPGYSDHTMGDHIMLASVALGAKVIEKHYTLDRTMEGPDHQFAIEPHELKEAMVKLREVENSLGKGIKNGPRPEEQEQMIRARRSLHVKRDMKTGEIITVNDLITKRPSMGIAPYKKAEIIGKKLCQDVPEDHWLTEEMIA